MEKLDLENVRIYSNTKNDVKDAIDLINQEVYMSVDADFENYHKFRLIGVRFVEDDPFVFVGSDYDAYKYLILVKDAKFKEETSGPSYRKFKSIDEFEYVGTKYHFRMGESIIIRNKETLNESELVYNGIFTNDESETFICLGPFLLSFDELFNKYEFYTVINDFEEWHPFGIKEWSGKWKN